MYSKERVVRPKINSKVCVKCLRCLVVCPLNAIKDDNGPKINYQRCDGCLICLRECPVSAIEEESI